MSRLPNCPICKKKDAVTTLVIDNDTSPYNHFVVSCLKERGGCGLKTKEETTWPMATAAWLKLAGSPTEDQTPPIFGVTTECPDCGCRWHERIEQACFIDIVASLEDNLICPICHQKSGEITAISLYTNTDRYDLRLRGDTNE